VTSPERFTVTDRRGVTRTASGLVVGGADNEMRRLRASGYSLPNSPTQARKAAVQVRDRVSNPGQMEADMKAQAAHMRRSRMANLRTGSDMTIALPKVRQPLSSLQDKNIPWNMSDPKEQTDARTWARLFYSTHDLIPLLVDIYAKFPVVGLEFQSKDPKIEQFYSEMFLNELNYEEFLPDCLGREYFISGEVTTLAHFNESLGVWSSEEVLNPEMVRVSKSIFHEEERVQLAVKDMVEGLRQGGPLGSTHESPSERKERTYEYQQLVKNYPEIIRAAEQDDGLDISEALWSRLVNRASPWDTRGTPFLMRSFRTLMMEESLNAAQDSVADRLYSPLILATLGIQDMGDGEPWIPDLGELSDLREDFQSALAADFKLMVHHFGLDVKPVFGRESVPRFDQDYDRIDAKLMQAWGIGQALIMGGTAAAGTYASSALNREVCEQLMAGFQRKVTRHIRKRMEIIAEAQEHYDYELKGGIRRPLYREVVEEDENGEQRIVRLPKLLIPEIKFRSLNLRDESTERSFITELKQMGVPISDKSLAVNIPIEFDQELQRQTEEMVTKQVAEAESMAKTQKICDEKGIPYPAWLVQSLTQTLMLRQQLSQTKLMEGQEEMQEQQMAQMMPAGQFGLIPGTQDMSGVMPGGMDPGAGLAGGEGDPGADFQQQMDAMLGGQQDPGQPGGEDPAGAMELPRNRQRPEISDERQGEIPRSASNRRAAKRSGKDSIRPLSKFEHGPSSYGASRHASQGRVEAAIRRREVMARHPAPRVSDLINDPEFYEMVNGTQYADQIQSDWPEIQNGGADETAQLLRDLVEQYTDATGVEPEWD